MKIRVISALVALLILIGLYVALDVQGLRYICVFGGLMSILEYARLTFPRLDAPRHLEWCFVGFSAILFFLTAGGLWGTPSLARLDVALIFSSVAAVTLIMLALLTVRTAEDLTPVLQVQAYSLMGLFYCGMFPGLVTRLLLFDHGQVWFLGFLAIVFSGDTFAYFAGRTFGKKKLLEPVSPKKTVAGSIGGLAGSAAAGLALSFIFFRETPAIEIVLMAMVTGAFAQVGDLFESLIKRVADVKDSGSLMPGHGGVLDRLDGVLFAAPVYFGMVTFLTT